MSHSGLTFDLWIRSDIVSFIVNFTQLLSKLKFQILVVLCRIVTFWKVFWMRGNML